MSPIILNVNSALAVVTTCQLDAGGQADRNSRIGLSATDLDWQSVSSEINTDVQETHPTLSLNGTWSVTALPLDMEGELGYQTFRNSASERLSAQVPGEIHLDLMRAGRMEDPSISDNAHTRCRWPEQHSWWYRTEFSVPPGFRQHLRQRLIFEGIDLYAQIFVNGKFAGSTKNAFAAAEFDVNDLLREGSNELVARVTSGMELIPKPVGPPALLKLDPVYAERSFIFEKHRVLRKPAYSAYGWDWCDALPNIGIWRGVRLEGRSQVVIHHLRLDTSISGREVALEGEVTLENLHPWSEIPCVLELRVIPPQGKPTVRHLGLSAQAGRFAIPCRLVIPHPQLWWPNGMGEQPLYELSARVLCGGQESDRQRQMIGLRTIELDRSPLPEGSRFCLRVNGEKVFCKGGNWVPADLIPARIDANHYQKLVAQAKDAHFTMLRVNGVGLYESDDFYDGCDRAGILVWQDFAFSCALYPDQDPQFLAMVRDEAQGLVKRLRHHPSLALWCGNNECYMVLAAWKSDPAKPEDMGGARIYSQLLPEICRSFDPVRPYWPGSPFGGIDPTSQTSGDTHGWGKLGTAGPPDKLSQEVADQCRARFISEYGIIGPPNMASVREFLKPDELSFESAGWKTHTNMFDAMMGGYTSKSIRMHYGNPKNLSLSQFVLYGQMFQAQLQSRAVDATRFRKDDLKDDCQGILVWSYNDTWGETGWSIVDHYLRGKASYYWFKRSAAPVKVLVRSRDGHLVTRVVNDTLRTYQAEVRCGWVRLDGKARELQKHSVTIPVNGMIEVASAPFPSPSERNRREWLYAATLTGEGIAEDQAIGLLAPHRELALAKPVISTTVQNGVLEVSSPVYCHGVHLEDEGREVLADNYFELLPGIPRHVAITAPTASGRYPLTAVMAIAS